MKTVYRLSGCKINLLLNILGRRPDGYHELETVIQPVSIHDELEFQRTGTSVTMECDRPDLPCDRSNLVVRAAEAFLERGGIGEGVRIRLAKRIPLEAGLGGGSGNAAGTLLGLNELFAHPLPHDVLHEIAAGLGSDVPSFLETVPVLATGRGGTIRRLEPFRALNGRALLLVHPGFGISTPWAYRSLGRFPDALNGRPDRARELIDALQAEHDASWAGLLHNSLERPAFAKYPVLSAFVERFREHGALAALMSGSGSSVFAWFDNRTRAESALDAFRNRFGVTGWTQILA